MNFGFKAFRQTFHPLQKEKKKHKLKQGITGDTKSLAQDYLVWVYTELGNFMTYNSYVNEETKMKC